MNNLTEREAKLLNYICVEMEKNGVPPTIREMCNAMGWSSTNSSRILIQRLREKGYIEAAPKRKARGVVPINYKIAKNDAAFLEVETQELREKIKRLEERLENKNEEYREMRSEAWNIMIDAEYECEDRLSDGWRDRKEAWVSGSGKLRLLA